MTAWQTSAPWGGTKADKIRNSLSLASEEKKDETQAKEDRDEMHDFMIWRSKTSGRHVNVTSCV